MTEGRRRQIIKRADPGPEDRAPLADEQAPEVEPYEYKESFLDRRVHLTWPMMVLGMVAVMTLSFLTTFIVVKWPEGSLEIPENQRLEALREDLAQETVTPRQASLPAAKPVEAPEVDLALSEAPQRTFAVVAETLDERSFERTWIGRIPPPVAAVSPSSYRADAVISNGEGLATPAALPETRPVRAEPMIADAATPRADLAPGDFRRAAAEGVVDLPGQKLMRRRFAKAVATPAAVGGLNPLQTVATAEGLEERSFGIQNVLKAGNPLVGVSAASFARTFDIPEATIPETKLMKRRHANAAGAPDVPGGVNPLTVSGIGQGLPQRSLTLRQARATGNPVAAIVPEVRIVSASTETAPLPNEKLLRKRYANAAGQPEADRVLDPLEIAATGNGLPERRRSFADAMGIDAPVADLSPGGFAGLAAKEAAGVPEERLLRRRFAKAATTPERLEIAVQPAISVEPGVRPFEGQPVAQGEENNPWRRYAARVPENVEGKGRIVVIIDDMGNNPAMARRLSELSGPLNFAFLPYAPGLESQTRTARSRGHELLVHLPMEPSGSERPGPRALMTSFDNERLEDEIDWNLSQFEGFVGVNNHMGSRFTEDEEKMRIVMKELKDRGLLFLDSLTSPRSKGRSLARAFNLPWAGRDIFLDNVAEEEAIMGQLRKVEKLAKTNGVAIAIGHPNKATYRALKAWIPTLEGKGLVLVPLSSVVRFEEQGKLAAGGGGK